MSTLQTKLIGGLLLALILGALVICMYHYKAEYLAAQDSITQLAGDLQAAKDKIAGEEPVLTAYRQQSERNADLQAQQQTTIQGITSQLADRRQTISKLERENAQLKTWADQRLPDPVVRLRQHPAITGADAYNRWLSSRGAVSAAGQQPTDQWRPVAVR